LENARKISKEGQTVEGLCPFWFTMVGCDPEDALVPAIRLPLCSIIAGPDESGAAIVVVYIISDTRPFFCFVDRA